LVASGCSALDNEVDAAVMGRGRFGAVAVVRGATNPIVIAQLVSDTPFVALVGDAALDLAGMLPRHGVLAHHADTRFAQYFDDDPKPRAAPPPAPPRPAAPATVDAEPRTESAEATPQRVDPQHDDGTAPPASSSTAEAEPAPSMRRLRPLGSAGAIAGFGVVARVGSDDFAAAVSTVGSLRMPRGRITAAPVEGAAIFAGAAGAVAATGEARHLIREQLARHVYERIAAGATAEEAVGWAIAGAPEGVALGVIAISNNDSYAAATRHFVSSKLALGTGGTL
jgi:isoaspartyl peptidase/L-asparaginase-like protein (Ntn-hydrolase superfamily)